MSDEHQIDDQHDGVRRRELIAGGVGAAVGASLSGAPPDAAAAPRPRRGARGPVYDVAVVGAGLAGLTAASAVRAAGRSVIVLEARDRVGGRNFDQPIAPGKVAELGGQWAGPGQDRILKLAKHLGVATFDTYSRGNSVYYRDGTVHTYTGDVPPASPAALTELVNTIVELNLMAASVPADRPWTAAAAASWDRETIATWMTEHMRTAEARDLGALAVRGVYGEESSQISLLDLLQAISGVGGDFNTLIGSAQSIRFVGGPQQLSEKLARRLGHRVHLRVPIRAVEQARQVTLHADRESFTARRAILTPPKTLIGRLVFSPPLPPGHDQLLQRAPMGSVVKVNAVYRTPFWRADGLSGAATSDTGPIRITYDNSPPDGHPGILVGFMEGNDSRAFYGRPPATRRHAAVECFARYFGPEARRPIAYYDLAWAEQPFTRGAYGSFNPPGVLTALHDPISTAVGRIHFAGADTSALWPGYMDGAIRSGEAAAREALAEL